MIKHLPIIFNSIFLVAFLTDNANITDLFPDVTTIHFEETEGVLADGCTGQSSRTLPQTLPHATSVTQDRSHQSQKLALFDQDSPSLPPDLTSIAIVALPFVADEVHTGSDVSGHLRLYLWDHSFLFRT
jgi:hypothetical protein